MDYASATLLIYIANVICRLPYNSFLILSSCTPPPQKKTHTHNPKPNTRMLNLISIVIPKHMFLTTDQI